ncbi:type VI secretion system baseplate subunit TssK [Rhodanobacter sp. OK091]|uniref:type VI secretion system baseplate subunit TssK n=1 Tax=Rhodanobacter sp. OK091 TaxID=1881037 RepID=UPI00090FE45D|nr:type VI secretion system baseplate subunit TssK [Rhodanobacter sp. OK091]SHL73174.1 type VI secretion protein, VC_A0114 family [Rhodanobacter sp. OK091]
MQAVRQVHWAQGGFLTPQHLQAQDAWQQAYALRLHRQFSPYHWGYEALVLREDALATGMATLERFVLLTRQGELISGGVAATAEGGGNARVPERSLLELSVPNNEPISLYLVLKRERTLDGLGRSEERGSRLPARHRLDGESRADPYDPQAPAAEVDFLGYQAQIISSLDEGADALLGACESYKFAEIVPNGPGRFKLSPDYIPPLVALQASVNLSRWARSLRDLLVSRGADFSSVKRQRGIRAASTSAQEVMRVVMMQTFARYIADLQEIVRGGVEGPYPLYLRLRELVAEFSVFSEEISFAGGLRENPADTELPPYDHDNLRACFRIAFQRAETLVKALTVGAEVGITLTFDGKLYKAELPPNLFESDKTRFYLAFESELRGQDLFGRLSRTGKICAIEEMPRLLQAALFGLKIDLLPVPPEELPQKTPNTTYFLVDTKHPFWQGIRNGRNMAVFCDLPPEQTVIKLYPVGAEE